MSISPQRVYWPTRSWRTASPTEFGADPERLAQLDRYAQGFDDIRSIFVARSGYVLFEEYYHGGAPNKYHNVNSVTKSITSALVGIAIDEGYLAGLDQTVLSFFPDSIPHLDDSRKQAITLQHLLTMTSGYQFPPDVLATFLEDTTSTEKMLQRPLVHNPGEIHGYDDVSLHFLSLILTSLTHMSLASYAQSRLFAPLGIWQGEDGTPRPWRKGTCIRDNPHPYGLWKNDDVLWSVDTRGYHPAGFGLQLITQDMAKFGHLYLNKGQWDGRQVVPAAYVQDAWTNHCTTPRGEGYGYLRYLPEWNGYAVRCAVGHGGQLIAVVPDLDLVVAITMYMESSPAIPPMLMKEFILPAFYEDE